jgi:hypothetical protein
MKLHGVISDRLRALFTDDQILNNPRQTESKPMPKTGVEGHKMGGRKPKEK